MKTKEKVLTKWIVAVVVIAVVVAGIVVFSLLNKDNDLELLITADDIVVERGESKDLEYQTSIKKAVVRFRVRDVKVAEVEEGSVLGKSVGETELTIIARYENLVYEKKIAVKVISNGIETPSDSDKPVEPEIPVSPTEPEDEEIAIELYAIMGCSLEDGKVVINAGKTAMIQVLTDEEYTGLELESSGAGLNATESEDSQRGLILKASEVGEYELTLKMNNKVAKIRVSVKQ